MATLEFKPPQTPPEPEPELNLLMPQGSESGLWKSLSQNFQDTFFPKKQPPLVLTSKPVPVKDIWGFYDHKKSGAALSTVVHIVVISLILIGTYYLGKSVVQKPKEQVMLVAPTLDTPIMKPSPKKLLAAVAAVIVTSFRRRRAEFLSSLWSRLLPRRLS